VNLDRCYFVEGNHDPARWRDAWQVEVGSKYLIADRTLSEQEWIEKTGATVIDAEGVEVEHRLLASRGFQRWRFPKIRKLMGSAWRSLAITVPSVQNASFALARDRLVLPARACSFPGTQNPCR
jgi:hypothetical protein